MAQTVEEAKIQQKIIEWDVDQESSIDKADRIAFAIEKSKKILQALNNGTVNR